MEKWSGRARGWIRGRGDTTVPAAVPGMWLQLCQREMLVLEHLPLPEGLQEEGCSPEASGFGLVIGLDQLSVG